MVGPGGVGGGVMFSLDSHITAGLMRTAHADEFCLTVFMNCLLQKPATYKTLRNGQIQKYQNTTYVFLITICHCLTANHPLP